MPKAVYVNENPLRFVRRVYAPACHDALRGQVRLEDRVLSLQDVLQGAARDADILLSTWGMPEITESEIASCLPQAKLLLYGAGTVQAFARPFLTRGVRVCSAWQANGIPVAEVTVSEIILSQKGMLRAFRQMRSGDYAAVAAGSQPYRGSFGGRVGVIGAGVIGRRVLAMLQGYDLETWVCDPFLTEDDARALGARKAELPELFEACETVSNHLANNPATRGLLDYSLFSRLSPTATFLNTGRGAQVVEADLIRALQEQPGRSAVLDVAWPEPPEAGHPFYTMDNVFFSPHLAGSLGDETQRMGQFMLDELRRYLAGQPLRYEVTLDMLSTMA